ncbi:hypothetical protein GCM10010347_43070 [Streptomyces cirratus]|uniref:Uncharacterized protein n=2 Tax=Streptomyces cirratus TaxID=68187 RepID=A0ABQ3EYC9_9ACTN|nr:hypothetical protein GCM10010347_43070 [Streptomyces cirratus]
MGADFRRPLGEPEPEPEPAPTPARPDVRSPPAASPSQTRTAMSERDHHGLRHVQDQLTTSPHRPVCQRLHLDSGRSRPGSRLGYRVPLRGAITDVTPPSGGSQRMSSKRSKNPALPVLDDAFRLASVKDAEESTRDLAARLATTELRRVSHPGRVTWEPTDQAEPVPIPPTVVDGDGDLWLRDRGTGTWTMPEFNPKEFPARCGEVLTWNELAREFGPLTALADDRRIGGGRR